MGAKTIKTCKKNLRAFTAYRTKNYLLSGIKNERMSNLEYLGSDMIEAGNEFGTTTPYGSSLVRVGQTEKK